MKSCIIKKCNVLTYTRFCRNNCPNSYWGDFGCSNRITRTKKRKKKAASTHFPELNFDVCQVAELFQIRVNIEGKKNQHHEDDLQTLSGLELPITCHSSCAMERTLQVAPSNASSSSFHNLCGCITGMSAVFKCYICCCLKCWGACYMSWQLMLHYADWWYTMPWWISSNASVP